MSVTPIKPRNAVEIVAFADTVTCAFVALMVGAPADSPELAAKVAEWRTQVLPRIAWRLTLEPAASADAVSGGEPRFVWTGIDGGQAVRHYGRDPEAAAWARVQAFILSLLPIERQL